MGTLSRHFLGVQLGFGEPRCCQGYVSLSSLLPTQNHHINLSAEHWCEICTKLETSIF